MPRRFFRIEQNSMKRLFIMRSAHFLAVPITATESPEGKREREREREKRKEKKRFLAQFRATIAATLTYARA